MTTQNKPTLEQLRNMLKEECELRNSDLIQRLYDAVAINYNRSEEVEDFVQSVVVARYEYSLSVDQYRQLLYKHREALKNDAFFMKHNIMVDCPLPLGKIDNSIVDAITLYKLDGLKPCRLSSLLNANKKTIILASSST